MSDVGLGLLPLRDRIKQDAPIVVAHRGDMRAGPENSRAAIIAARAVDMVEIDVRLSADGVPFVMHDEDLWRTAGRKDSVDALSAAELSASPLLNISENVPSLAEALDAAGPSLYVDVDVKDASELDLVAAFLATTGDAHRVMLKMDVTDAESLAALQTLETRHGIPVIAKLQLMDQADLDLVDAVKNAGVLAAEIGFSRIALVAEACARGLPISVYTLDEIACDGYSDAKGRSNPDLVWGHLEDLGVRLFMTDAPEIVADFLDATTDG